MKFRFSLAQKRENIERLGRIRDVMNQPQLIIWAGHQRYELSGQNFPLTTPEIEWLEYELSDWLNLPVTRE